MAMTVQEYVQGLLDEHGVKGNAVAAKAGMSASYFYRVLSGDNISPKFLRKIAPHVPGASVHRMMVLAGLLPDEDEVNGETLEDLKLRVHDLTDKLGVALEKYARQLEASDVAFIEGPVAKKVLQLLLASVEEGKVFDQFGFVEYQASVELVEKLTGLREGQGKALIPVVQALGKANLHMADDADDH
ncbi:hypothetical protein [Alicyclobacillus fodiniaquatilis]|uniref:HTH cro/C1-type domain-containing protein n=1 Tax=Alicyclobacillus fodiniaquatilis TaxID=1661150 RepID=A0ABW4JF22_9BACL